MRSKAIHQNIMELKTSFSAGNQKKVQKLKHSIVLHKLSLISPMTLSNQTQNTT